MTPETEFWKSSGFSLVRRDSSKNLIITADLLRAYFTRPEVHPVDDSCASEIALFERLMDDPFATVSPSEVQEIKDRDTAANYSVVLHFRDHLAEHKTAEAAYRALFSGEKITLPPVFIDQLAHLILRNILDDCDDPMQLRAGELFFREQLVNTDDERLMLADREIVDMRAAKGFGGLAQLIAADSDFGREVSLDIISEENKGDYWNRSDRFDMAMDFRFTEPASDALGRVIEKWVSHFFGVRSRVTAMKSIQDERWSWHVGLDRHSTDILNRLYNGEVVDNDRLYQIIALYQLEFLDNGDVIETMHDKPVYMALAMDENKVVAIKPQNLLTNLPLRACFAIGM